MGGLGGQRALSIQHCYHPSSELTGGHSLTLTVHLLCCPRHSQADDAAWSFYSTLSLCSVPSFLRHPTLFTEASITIESLANRHYHGSSKDSHPERCSSFLRDKTGAGHRCFARPLSVCLEAELKIDMG